MSKVLFFTIPLQGHTNPTLPLAQELVRRGEEVVYYSLEPFRASIEDIGAGFRSYGSTYEVLPPPTNAFDGMSRVIIKRSPKILGSLLPEVQAYQPDYILHDALAAWGRQFGEILGVPTICSTTTFVLGTRMWFSVPSLLPELLQQRWQARKEVALACSCTTTTCHIPRQEALHLRREREFWRYDPHLHVEILSPVLAHLRQQR
jgi:UDP:flavonoid glycosyltransferase YjiC (YdhE family)